MNHHQNGNSMQCQTRVHILCGFLAASVLVLPGKVEAQADSQVPLNVAAPCIQVVKLCAYPSNSPTCFPPDANIDFTGSVTNCGTTLLTNVTLTDNRPLVGAGLLDTNGSALSQPFSLTPGQTIRFHGSFEPTLGETCTGAATNSITARGTDTTLALITAIGSVSNTAISVCAICVNPCLTVTKNCDTVQIGQPNTVSGGVTNCGNITITNIVISDNRYGTLTNIPSLAPGTGQSYSRLVTNDTCGTFSNTVSASGTTVCGQPIIARASNSCVVTANACLGVTKTCDTVTIGHANTVTAVVTNCGSVAINGLLVTDSLYGTIGTILSLAPGAAATLTKSVTNHSCGSFSNVVTASGSFACGLQPPINEQITEQCVTVIGNPIMAQSTNVCVVTENPCLGVTGNCNSVSIEQGNTLMAVVTNCGSVIIRNISVSNSLYGSIGSVAALAPGQSFTFSRTVTNSACGNFTNVVTASGFSDCSTAVQAASTNVCSVTGCAPKICVTKEVVCELPTGCANNWSSFAAGAKTSDNSQCPSFCYRFRVTNCGGEALRNVTVLDDLLDISACNFPTTLALGQSVECIVAGVTNCFSVTNTVMASGVSVESGSNVTASATAVVEVRPIEVTCNATVNGETNITIRCDGEVHLVTNAFQICNTGELPLAISSLNAHNGQALGGDCGGLASLRFSLQPGECTNVSCVEPLLCYRGEVCSFEHQVDITVLATVDTTQTNACSYTRNESNQVVAVRASCSSRATVTLNADSTPPRIDCRAGVNPSAKKIPVAGKNPASGQNPDGYYELLAKDDCDPDPLIYVFDTGSDFIAGPFHSGDVIKLTQSPGKKPSQDSAPAPIVAHLHFKGDALAIAVDANGNTSYDGEGGGGCLMLVPRPPK